MTIDFYINFDKRVNSTKRPVEGGIVVKHTLTGYLKEPSSVMNPVINIQNPPTQNTPCVYTYAYIPQFYRYYFVKDWVWNDGLWTVELQVDVLATYKPHIGDTTAYVERSASDHNTYIIDKLYPATTEPSKSDVIITAPWTNFNVQNGCFVLGVISNTTSASGGAVTYYALTYSQISSLVDYLLSDSYIDASGFTTTSQEPITHNIAKALLNPIQYLVSCTWIPRTASSIGESSPRQIQVGYYPVPQTIAEGYWLSDRTIQFSCTVALPFHPDANTRGQYLNYMPFTKLTCFLPPFGQFPIDNQYFDFTYDSAEFIAVVDLATGKSDLRVRVTDGTNARVIYTTSAMFGVPIQLAQVSNDVIKATTSTISAVGNVVGAIAQGYAGNYVGATHSGLMALQSVGNAIEAQMPHVVSDGVDGSFAAFRQTGWITAHFQKLVDEDNTEQGRPLCEVRTINTLSGYIKCGEATVDFYAFKDELEMIHRYMLSGFFWE